MRDYVFCKEHKYVIHINMHNLPRIISFRGAAAAILRRRV